MNSQTQAKGFLTIVDLNDATERFIEITRSVEDSKTYYISTLYEDGKVCSKENLYCKYLIDDNTEAEEVEVVSGVAKKEIGSLENTLKVTFYEDDSFESALCSNSYFLGNAISYIEDFFVLTKGTDLYNSGNVENYYFGDSSSTESIPWTTENLKINSIYKYLWNKSITHYTLEEDSETINLMGAYGDSPTIYWINKSTSVINRYISNITVIEDGESKSVSSYNLSDTIIVFKAIKQEGNYPSEVWEEANIKVSFHMKNTDTTIEVPKILNNTEYSNIEGVFTINIPADEKTYQGVTYNLFKDIDRITCVISNDTLDLDTEVIQIIADGTNRYITSTEKYYCLQRNAVNTNMEGSIEITKEQYDNSLLLNNVNSTEESLSVSADSYENEVAKPSYNDLLPYFKSRTKYLENTNQYAYYYGTNYMSKYPYWHIYKNEAGATRNFYIWSIEYTFYSDGSTPKSSGWIYEDSYTQSCINSYNADKNSNDLLNAVSESYVQLGDTQVYVHSNTNLDAQPIYDISNLDSISSNEALIEESLTVGDVVIKKDPSKSNSYVMDTLNSKSLSVNGSAKSADTLTTARRITIKDVADSNSIFHEAYIDFNGSENKTLTLPSTLNIDITGNSNTSTEANTSLKWKSPIEVEIKDFKSRGSNPLKTSIDGSKSVSIYLPESVNLSSLSVDNGILANSVGNSTNGVTVYGNLVGNADTATLATDSNRAEIATKDSAGDVITDKYALKTTVEELRNSLTSAFSYKGSVSSKQELEAIQNPSNGDIYSVNGVSWIYGNGVWSEFGGSTPNATDTSLGLVKGDGSNTVTITNGSVSITKNNVSNSLGFTPVKNLELKNFNDLGSTVYNPNSNDTVVLDFTNYLTSSSVDSKLEPYAKKSDYVTLASFNSTLSDYLKTSTFNSSISNYYTKEASDSLYPTKSTVYTKEESDSKLSESLLNYVKYTEYSSTKNDLNTKVTSLSRDLDIVFGRGTNSEDTKYVSNSYLKTNYPTTEEMDAAIAAFGSAIYTFKGSCLVKDLPTDKTKLSGGYVYSIQEDFYIVVAPGSSHFGEIVSATDETTKSAWINEDASKGITIEFSSESNTTDYSKKGTNVAWVSETVDGSGYWDSLAGSVDIDLSDYMKRSELNSTFVTKDNLLIFSNNIYAFINTPYTTDEVRTAINGILGITE